MTYQWLGPVDRLLGPADQWFMPAIQAVAPVSKQTNDSSKPAGQWFHSANRIVTPVCSETPFVCSVSICVQCVQCVYNISIVSSRLSMVIMNWIRILISVISKMILLLIKKYCTLPDLLWIKMLIKTLYKLYLYFQFVVFKNVELLTLYYQ